VKKLLVFLGDSGSGKTRLIEELRQKFPDKFKKVVTCTSRPPRACEVKGVDYHFQPAEYFVDNPSIVLVQKTSTGYTYGTRRVDLYSDSHHLLLTSKPSGVAKLVKMGFRNIITVIISITRELQTERMRQRGDTEEAIATRLRLEASTTTVSDFSGSLVVDLNAEKTIEEKVEAILRACY
jgi:guanylate kinase